MPSGVSPGGRPIDESPLSQSKTSNFVARHGGLPPYIRGVARGIAKRRHGGKVTGSDIAAAKNKMEDWAANSKNPAVKAAAIAALAQWHALFGATKGHTVKDLSERAVEQVDLAMPCPPSMTPGNKLTVALLAKKRAKGKGKKPRTLNFSNTEKDWSMDEVRNAYSKKQEDKRKARREANVAKGLPPYSDGPADEGSYRYVHEVHSNHVIVHGGGGNSKFRVPYDVQDDGSFKFGNEEPVKQVYVPEKKSTVSLSNRKAENVDLSSHVPGTPYKYKHGWVPLRHGDSVSKGTAVRFTNGKTGVVQGHGHEKTADGRRSVNVKDHASGNTYSVHPDEISVPAPTRKVGPSREEMVKNAATMYGTGSKQHKAAIAKFGRDSTVAKRDSAIKGRLSGPGKYSIRTDRNSSIDHTTVSHYQSGSGAATVAGTVRLHPNGKYIASTTPHPNLAETELVSLHDKKAQAIAAVKKRHAKIND